MDLTNIPTLVAVPFASGADSEHRNSIPVNPTTAGAASQTQGFPDVCFQPIASGGIPPSGSDFNGVLYDHSNAIRWEQAGGQYSFDAAFASSIGGYPKGAILLRSDGSGQWISTSDNNSTDPDSASASGWIALRANTGTASIAAVAGANAPTPTQLGAQVLLVTGSIASNASLTLPLVAGAQWTVVNNTTGSGTLSVQGSTGSGVTVSQGTGIIAYTDGTNYYAVSAAVSAAYLPIDGTAVAATKLATPRNFSANSGPVTWGAQSFDGTADVTFNTSIANGALSMDMVDRLTSELNARAKLIGDVFTGSVGGVGVYATSFGLSPASSQGAYFGWNQDVTGRTELWNNQGMGSGGWRFVNIDSDGNARESVTIDSSGNITAPSISGSASKLTTPRSIALGELAGGSAEFDGSADVTLNVSSINVPSALGYTPVQQGGGVNQETNKVYLGHSSNGPSITIDSTDFGAINFRADFTSSLGVTGWRSLPADLSNRKVIEQWGTLSTSNSGSVTGSISFPVTFPNACLNVILVNRINSPIDVNADCYAYVVSIGTGSFTYYVMAPAGGTNSWQGMYWRAIGY